MDLEKGLEQQHEEEKLHKKKKRFAFNGNILKFSQDPIEIDVARIQSKLKYKYILVFFLALCIILTSISVSGCSNSSKGSANNFLMQLRYAAYEQPQLSGDGIVNTDAYTTWNSNVENKTDMTVRIGYFGTCTRSTLQTSSTAHHNWFCTRNVTLLASIIDVPTQDPFNVIYLMNNVRNHHVSPAILIVSVCINFIALVFLLRASLKRPSLYFISTGLTVFACTLGLIGMVWQQASVDTAVSVARNLSNNSIVAHSGRIPAGLGWTSIFLLFCTAIGIVCLVLSEKQALLLYNDIGEDIGDPEAAHHIPEEFSPDHSPQHQHNANQSSSHSHHEQQQQQLQHPQSLVTHESLSIPGNLHSHRVPYPLDEGIPKAY
ncbi:uncharacterized protein SAPINGB_P005737 [Magnusiomyces paraingens]|uniref:Uncharacterized protein n=1 Tax=Magnusiomyces paraingens TaxID=2606893 RepID=A0A5E8C6A5_9ASCO|nr:uncharacterized protein SAPINGB_P005737 [Saprochaete ingens]VVT57521.1 unnamed protein product [Saprochaete ingens]